MAVVYEAVRSTDVPCKPFEAAEEPAFRPEVHLGYRAPVLSHTFADLDLTAPDRLSDFAYCEPFQLISEAGVSALFSALASDPVQQNCKFTSLRTPCAYRGVAGYSKFVKDFWSSPAVTGIVSEIAGIALKPIMEYELGVANVQVPGGEETALVDSWHFDSYPFVVITLLNDPSAMRGGETVLQRGDGSELPVSFPAAGTAIVLQGQHVRHCARRALSSSNRITMVTSYVPADPRLPDHSVLRGPKLMSDLAQLNNQWAEHRLSVVGYRALAAAQELQARRTGDGKLEGVEALRAQMAALMEYLRTTMEEMSDGLTRPAQLGLTPHY